MNSTGIAVAVLGVVAIAGIAIYYVNMAKAASSAEAVAAYEQGRDKGSHRTQAERLGGAIGTVGSEIWGIFG
jgi:hypothetical protein